MEFSNSPCEDYVSLSCVQVTLQILLQLYRHHDSGLLLAAIAEGISNEGESIANKLLASEYEVLFKILLKRFIIVSS